MLPRTTAVERPTFLRGYGSAADEPDASLATRGSRLTRARCHGRDTASVNAREPRGSSPRSRRVDGTSAAAPGDTVRLTTPLRCAAPPPRPALTGAPRRCSPPLEEDGTRGQRNCSAAQGPLTRYLGHRPRDGERASRRVWCSPLRSAPAEGKAVRTPPRVRTAPAPETRQHR
jgi:hypothetical protein